MDRAWWLIGLCATLYGVTLVSLCWLWDHLCVKLDAWWNSSGSKDEP